ncbi:MULTISPECIES: hypothetical protein [Legionella]|nr:MULTISPECIES: hypothetical protein [Legionella]
MKKISIMLLFNPNQVMQKEIIFQVKLADAQDKYNDFIGDFPI